MPSAALRRKSRYRACLTEGWPDRGRPARFFLERARRARSQVAPPESTCRTRSCRRLVEGRSDGIAASRRILEQSTRQILPTAGIVSGPRGPLTIQGPAKGSRRAASGGLWTSRDHGIIACVSSRVKLFQIKG